MRRLLAATIALALLCAASGSFSTRAVAFGGCNYPYYCLTLTVDVGGVGSGSWQSADANDDPDGKIHCNLLHGTLEVGSVCQYKFNGPVLQPIYVNYLLKPSVGSYDCDPDACSTGVQQYTVKLTANTTWTADRFDPQNYNVTVTKSGAGTGEVVADPGRLDCGINCTYMYPFDSLLKLTAIPDPGDAFEGWTEACAGQGPVCTVKVGIVTTANAIFGLATPPPTATPKPSASQTPTGTAKPTASPQPTSQPTASPINSAPAPTNGASSPAVPSPAASLPTSAPTDSVQPSSTTTPTAIAAVPASTTPAPSLAAVPVSATPAADYTPIAVALLLGLLGIAVAIGFVGYQVRRRS